MDPKKTKKIPDLSFSEEADIDIPKIKNQLSTHADQIFFIKWLQIGILLVLFLAVLGWLVEAIYRASDSHDRFFTVLTEYERLESLNKKVELLEEQVTTYEQKIEEVTSELKSLEEQMDDSL